MQSWISVHFQSGFVNLQMYNNTIYLFVVGRGFNYIHTYSIYSHVSLTVKRIG